MKGADSRPVSGRAILRPAIREDAEEIADLYLESRKTFLPFAPLRHTDEEVRRWMADSLIPAGGVMVATTAAGLAGMIAISRDAEYGWIQQLYVRPSWVGRGIGTQLLEWALHEINAPVRLYTFQANTAARRFYERHGFIPIAYGDGSSNEEKCPDVLYERQLAGGGGGGAA